ncbi:hypothetical protein [Tessaracoccus oleiagri]|uniref:Uncharacterized protein n=1 Tax=Tessaracoccus oleiagri TaxID=686624 RepID=A0A1G9K2B6_9ACTN|nr:hypothetical protein [Tessaracoccus oleiagri]SDL43544.1 hypothetical protein SAMN04488242_1586 [Tessaracoccus oleiagri]
MVDFYAVAIDDVRDMFGADGDLAEELIAAARVAFPEEPHRRRAFLPLMRRAPEFTVANNRPTREDLSILLSGGYVSPERMRASWRLFHALLDHRSAAHITVDVTEEELERAEFDLARNGLDTYYSLRRLGERQLGIPLRGIEGHIDGYAKHVHVLETAAELRRVLGDVEPETRRIVNEVLGMCDVVAADPRLDLVVLES